MTIYDGDTLEEHNLPGGFFRESDLGSNKAVATASFLKEINGSSIDARPCYFRKQDIESEIVILAVDSAEARIEIVKELHEQWTPSLVIDARSGWHQGQVFVFNPRNTEMIDEWKKTLEEDTIEEMPCGAKAVAYNPVTIAGCVSAIVRNYSMQNGIVPQNFLVHHLAMMYQTTI